LYPYMIETRADETWELDHFPTQRERAALDDRMAPWDLEEALAVRARSDDAGDFDVVWVDPPPHFNGQPTMYPEIAEGQAQAVDPDLPALAHLHACEYSATAILETKAARSTSTYIARCTSRSRRMAKGLVL
ncbi:MAG TPA: hypothetical protein VLW65_21840, partial [Bryobacteraceae bacterium]|nr:hypothetical protein [Bryobacteraceae bacterium]